jgi:hypothetical protein
MFFLKFITIFKVVFKDEVLVKTKKKEEEQEEREEENVASVCHKYTHKNSILPLIFL